MSSWFNPDTKLWRASAPAFTHVIHGCPDAALLGNTRVQALKNIISSPKRTVQVWVTNWGHGIPRNHLREVVLTPGYSTVGTLGEGFKMMQVVDRLRLMTGRGGTTVVWSRIKRMGWAAEGILGVRTQA